MNSDQPQNQRQALESSLTALLLGELPPDHAAALRELLVHDAELAKLHDRLKCALDLVREIEASPMTEPVAASAPLKLSDDRRQKLLERFKTVTPKHFAKPARREMSWVVPVGIAAAIVLLLAAIAVPNFTKARSTSAATFNARLKQSDVAELRRELINLAPEASRERSLSYSRPAKGYIAQKSESQPLQRTESAAPAASATASARNSSSISVVLPQTENLAYSGGFGGGGLGGGVPSSAGHFAGVAGTGGGRLGGIGPSARTAQSVTTASVVPSETAIQPALSQDLGINRNIALPSPVDPTTGLPVGSVATVDPATGLPPGTLVDPTTGLPLAGVRSTLGASFVPLEGKEVGGKQDVPVLGDVPLTDRFFRSGSATYSADARSVPSVALVTAPGANPSAENDIAPGFFQQSATPNGRAPVPAMNQPKPGLDFKTYSLDSGGRYAMATPDARGSWATATGKDETRALGFDWYLGNYLTQGSQIQPMSADKMHQKNGNALISPDGGQPLSISNLKEQLRNSGDTTARRTYAPAPAQESAVNEAISQQPKPAPSALAQALPAEPHAAVDQAIALERQQLRETSVSLEQRDGKLASVKSELDEFKRSLQLTQMKLASQGTDLDLPKSSTVVEPRQNGEERQKMTITGITTLTNSVAEQEKKVALAKQDVERLEREISRQQADVAPAKPAAPAPIPQPEVQTRENAFSTFSLNVSDVSFKLAAASLEKGVMPEAAAIRSEEFINAFDYHDPEAPPGVPVAFAWERARYPFAQNRDLLRFALKTAVQGRQTGRPLNLVLLLDNSGSMERADRVSIIHEALRVLASQLRAQDTFSVVTFSRTARLCVDGVHGDQAGQVAEEISKLTPEGGTNLEEAMNLAYQTALKHYIANGINRVVLLTDGAANLGNVEPEALKQKVESHRKQGIALDCFGIGWEGYNDDLLEVLSRNGDGRYGFINTTEEAATEFVGQLAGALHVAASDVKVQVEFNPARVTAYRQVGYARHQLTKEQFRDNSVDAAEIGAAESGNALYVVETNPGGEGPLAIVRVRYKVPGTAEYHEHEWAVPYAGNAVSLEQASPAMRLAATASAFSEWLASSPYAAEITPDKLLGYLSGVPEVYGPDVRPKKLEWMIRQANSLARK